MLGKKKKNDVKEKAVRATKEAKAEKQETKAHSKQQVIFSDMDTYLFGKGRHYEIYKKLGAHPSVENGKNGYFFAVWAPNAQSVSVVGDFNNWDSQTHPMQGPNEVGIWTLFIPGLKEGDIYKYYICVAYLFSCIYTQNLQ